MTARAGIGITGAMPSLFARQLRTDSTDAEIRLWSRLRGKQIEGLRFRRQQPMGPYIVDFYCAEVKLIIEVDGGQHADEDPNSRELAREQWLPCYEILEQ